MNFCIARDLTVANQQGNWPDAFAFGADHQPLNVGVGVLLGLILAEERSEPYVEVDELARPQGALRPWSWRVSP